MALTVSKKRLEEALADVQESATYGVYKDEVVEALQYAIENYNKQNKEAYIATLEAKVYTYEMIIAKSNFRSMLDPTRNNKPNNRQNNRQNNDRQPNNQRNNRSSLGQRSQRRSQYRNQDGSYRKVNPRNFDNGTDEGVEE